MLKEIINRPLLNHLNRFCFFKGAPLVMCFLWSSCGKKVSSNIEVPPNILNEEQFAKVLMDFSLAESASNTNIKNVPFQKTDTVYAFDPLKENGVRKGQYDSTIFFYSQNSASYKKIYENVLEKIIEFQTERNLTVTPVSKQ